MLLIGGSCCRGQVRFRRLNHRVYSVSSVKLMHVSVCSSVDVMEEAKKLVGAGNKYLVLGDVVSAVAVFQDACSML